MSYTAPPTPPIVALRAPDAASIDLAGGKAAQLSALLHWGFPIPNGLCLTTMAYARIARQAPMEAPLAALADGPSPLSAREGAQVSRRSPPG
jgi:pyruvate,water dikinase